MGDLNKNKGVLNQSLLEAIPIATAEIVIDENKDILIGLCNSLFKDIWPITPDNLKKNRLALEFLDVLRDRRLLPEQNNFRKFKAHIERNILKQETFSEEWHLPDNRSLKIRFKSLNINQSIFTVEDLTPNFIRERVVAELQQTSQLTYDQVDSGIAIFGNDGLIQKYNKSIRYLWSLPKDFFATNPHLSDFLDATRRQLPVLTNWPHHRQKLTGKLLSRKKGSKTIKLNTGMVLKCEHIPINAGATLLKYRDISYRMELDSKLRNMESTIVNQSQKIDDFNIKNIEFFRGITNDASMPLKSIVSSTELLVSSHFGDLNESQAQYINRIQNEAEIALNLLVDSIELLSINSGISKIEIDTIDLHVFLTKLISMFSNKIKSKKIKLRLECPLNFGWMDTDSDKLRICLLNLIKSSISSTGSGGIITINTERTTDKIRIDIIDTSKGLSKIDLSKIFDNFNRKDIRDVPSHSAGIVFANRVLDLLGGKIKIKSKINQGTTISLIFPQSADLTSLGLKPEV